MIYETICNLKKPKNTGSTLYQYTLIRL